MHFQLSDQVQSCVPASRRRAPQSRICPNSETNRTYGRKQGRCSPVVTAAFAKLMLVNAAAPIHKFISFSGVESGSALRAVIGSDNRHAPPQASYLSQAPRTVGIYRPQLSRKEDLPARRGRGPVHHAKARGSDRRFRRPVGGIVLAVVFIDQCRLQGSTAGAARARDV